MDFLTTLLNDACPAGSGPDAEGFSEYYIANHCVEYLVTARVAARHPVTNVPTSWEVRDWTYQ